MAHAEFAGISGAPDLFAAVSSWVGTQLRYVPGLEPMDFHAVAEAAVDGCWRAVDAALLAPRSSLVRIASGRDAADTAFLSMYGGAATLLGTAVTAVLDGDLPADDVTQLVTIG